MRNILLSAALIAFAASASAQDRRPEYGPAVNAAAAKKIAAIQRCIAKGTLTVSLSKVDLTGGKLGGPWLYD